MTSSTADAMTNLCFHGLGTPDRPLELGEDIHWVPPDLFLRVLDLVADRQDVSISFDDGNESDVTVGLPALVERGLSAGLLRARRAARPARFVECLSVPRATRLSMKVGSHGMDHTSWRRLTSEQASGELDDARSPSRRRRESRWTPQPVRSASTTGRLLVSYDGAATTGDDQ